MQDEARAGRRRRWLWIALATLLGLIVVLAGLVRRALGPSLDYAPLVSLAPAADGYCIEGARVFPGDTAQLLEDQRVVVEGDRIVRVEPVAAGACPDGHARIEGRGRTLLPGFIDAHVHVLSPAGVPWSPSPPAPEHNLQAWLASGVTTVYDLGGPASLLADLAAEVEAGEVIGPHLVHGHVPITIPDGHPIPAGKALARFPLTLLIGLGASVVEGPDEAPAAVAERAELRVPYVKIIRDRLPPSSPEMDDATLEALVAAAHEQGMLAFVHVGDEDDAAAALRAGADLLAHMPYHGEPHDLPRDSGARMVATLHGFEATVALARGELEPSALARALHPPELLDPVTGEAGRGFLEFAVLEEFATTLEREADSWPERLARARGAGVRVLVGTDAPLPGVFAGSGFHEEIAALSRAGVPAAAIFQGATWDAATLLTDTPDYGAVREGLRADLVLIEGNPLDDPTLSTQIAEVFVDGRRVERTLESADR